MTQLEMKTKCIELMNKYGTPQAYIAKQCEVSRTTISLFLKDQRILADPVAEKLENWLNNL